MTVLFVFPVDFGERWAKNADLVSTLGATRTVKDCVQGKPD